MLRSFAASAWLGSLGVAIVMAAEIRAQDVIPPLAVEAPADQERLQPVVEQPPRPGLTDSLPAPTLAPGFGIPAGLQTAPAVLLPSLGYGTADCFPLTPVTCFDVGYKCYTCGLYGDSLAFADHGLKQCNHARLYLLKAMCEMQLGRCDAASATLGSYSQAVLFPANGFGLGVARERLNDPMRVRLELLLAARTTRY